MVFLKRLASLVQSIVVVAIVALLPTSQAAPPAAAKPTATFEFELASEEGFPMNGPQKWQQVLSDLKVGNLQIRKAQQGDKPSIEKRGTERAPAFHVRGILTANNQLVVPGGRFSANDKAEIAKWLRELSDNGVEGVTIKKAAFGLTPSQLEAVQADLKQTVGFSTKGLAPGQAIGKIRQSLKLPLKADETAADLFKADGKLSEELEGMSCGTAIAIILRPAGAMLQPGKPAGGELGYRVTKSDKAAEAWPIGWPSESPPNKTVPTLFEFLNVEFEKVPLNDVLAAIQGRLNVPVIMDQNSMATLQIDAAKLISFPAKKTFYAKVLDDVLFKAGLKYEIRVDEADKPFLWVTTVRRA